MIYFKMADLDALATKPKKLEELVRKELDRMYQDDANPYEKLVADLVAAIQKEHAHHQSNKDLRPSGMRRIAFDIRLPEKGKIGGCSYHPLIEI